MSRAMLLALGVFTMGPSADPDEMTAKLRDAFAVKGKAFPYYAEYDLAMPPQPRIAGSTDKRRFVAEKADVFYAETIAEAYQCRALLRGNRFLWEYHSGNTGTQFVKASVDLGKQSPEVWLANAGFWNNSFSALDADLILVLRQLFADSKLQTAKGPGQLESFIWASKTGAELAIRLGASEAHIVAKIATGADGLKPIFRYDCQEGVPPWKPTPQAALLERFGKAKAGSIHMLKGDVSHSRALDELDPKGDPVRDITVKEAREEAKRRGYLFPSREPTNIRRATMYGGGLTLEIIINKHKYLVSQNPGPRNWMDSIKHLIANRRQFKDYSVLEFRNPGLKNPYIVYAKAEAVLTVLAEPLEFDDAVLDELIASFESITNDDRRK